MLILKLAGAPSEMEEKKRVMLNLDDDKRGFGSG